VDTNTLKRKRDVARLLLIFDLLSGKIDSSYVLSQIGLHVPYYQTRSREMLHIEFLNRSGFPKPFKDAIVDATAVESDWICWLIGFF
jgi:hypothetical protein